MPRSSAFYQFLQKLRERRRVARVASERKQQQFLRRKRRHLDIGDGAKPRPAHDPLADLITDRKAEIDARHNRPPQAFTKPDTRRTPGQFRALETDSEAAGEEGRGGNAAARRRGRHAITGPQLAAQRGKQSGASTAAPDRSNAPADEIEDVWRGAFRWPRDDTSP